MIKGFIFGTIIITIFSCQSKQVFELTDWEKDGLKGNVQAIREYSGDTLLLRVVEYNILGYKEKILLYMPPTGKLWKEINFVYENNFLVKEIATVDGETYKTKYKRNQLGQIKEEISIFPNNEINSRILYEYDNKNRIMKRTYVSKNLHSYSYTFEYTPRQIKEFHCTYGLCHINDLNENGLIIKRNEYKSNGDVHSGRIYEYNDNNDVVLEIVLWNNKETDRIVYEYTYDDKGNWIIKNRKWESGVGVSSTKREIIYR